MVKENGMVMMSEAEYNEMKNKIWELDNQLDIAKMELATYHQSVKKFAERNIDLKEDEKILMEIPARDFVDIMETMINEAFEDNEKFNKLQCNDLVFEWNGISSRLQYGPEIFNEVLPGIKEAYEEINE